MPPNRPYNPRIDGPRTKYFVKPAPAGNGEVQRGLPPELRDKKGSGMGNPFEFDFWSRGYRDPGQGEARPLDVVYDPACEPKKISENKRAELDEFFCRQRKEFQRSVMFVKKPANIEPPWFSKPLIKVKCNQVVAPGATATIFTRVIGDRQRAVITTLGIDVAPVAPLLNCSVEFWFAQGGPERGDIVNLFDDQTPTAYGGSTPVEGGRTTVLPGSVENPYNFLEAGQQFRIKGRKDLTFSVENKSGVSITIRGILGMYIYWLPWGATEFESADVQL